MLYKKNTEKTLSDNLFQNPTSEYRGAPFWGWNCKLNEDTLRRQIGYFKEMGFGGFHMHARAGMASEYLGEEFMHMISSCVDEAKKQNMLAWLYDEDKWPSGYAGGFVTKNPEYVQRMAVFAPEGIPIPELTDRKTAVADGKDYLIGCYDIELNQHGELASYRMIDMADTARGTKWTVYCTTGPRRNWLNGEIYVDTLNKKAIDKFIEITHEKYKDTIGEEFGKCIPAIFSDEPKFWLKGNLTFAHATDKVVQFPWTPSLPEMFEEHTGMDIYSRLPELIWNLPNGEISQYRYLFHDYVTELFVSSYVDNISKWCEDNGIMMTGHMMREENLNIQTDSIGEAMRCYRGFQLPGIDTLIDNDLTLYNAAKQAQSAVHQYGREGMLTELYGVTGWDFDFRHHKIQGDWEAAMGATVRVPHVAWMSMAGESKRDYPASINYQSPWYQEYKYIEDHFARVNTAMTRGKPDVKIGVIHPIESCWLHWGPTDTTHDIRQHLDKCFDELCQWLTFGTTDFDYISESNLPDLYKGCDNGRFNIGCMSYSVVIIPVMETMRQTTLDALTDFSAKGGKIIFASACPRYIDAIPSDAAQSLYNTSTRVAFNKYEILGALSDYRDIEVYRPDGTKAEKVICNMRIDEDCKWLFLTHGVKNYGDRFAFATYNDPNSPLAEDIVIKLRGEYSPLMYDTLTGDICKVPHSYSNGYTIISHQLYSESSLLLKLNYGKDEGYTPPAEPKEEEVITLRGKHEYILDEPNVFILDTAEFAMDNACFEAEEEVLRIDTICRARLGLEPKNLMAQPWVEKERNTGHTLTLRFAINSDIDVNNAMLAIEDAEKHEITLNGEKVTSNICGYFTDEAIKTVPLPAIKVGTNILTIKMDITTRSNAEWCYILGNFGVKVEGSEKTIITQADKIGYSPLHRQTMPFYGGNITYINEIETPECDIIIKTPAYRGAAVKVFVDGTDCGNTSLAPNSVRVNNITSGKHTIAIKLFGNRYNSFGALHNTVDSQKWKGPEHYRTTGNSFSYEYQLKDMGILAAPTVTIINTKG